MVQHGDDPWIYKKRPLMLMPSLSLMFEPQSSRSIIKKQTYKLNIFSWDHLGINWMANACHVFPFSQGAQGAQDPATGRHLPLLRARPRCLALGPGAPGAPGDDAASAQRGSWAAAGPGGIQGNFQGRIFMGFCWDFEFWWSDFDGIDGLFGLLMVLVG